MDLQHPELKEDHKQWSTWVLDVGERAPLKMKNIWTEIEIQTTGAAGFRLDAIKHMDHQFLLEWVRR